MTPVPGLQLHGTGTLETDATSIEQNPTHTYFSAGTYNVNLLVSNADGTSSKTATITALENGGSRVEAVWRRRWLP